MRLQVAQLLHEMHQEQKLKMSRRSRTIKMEQPQPTTICNASQASSEVVYKASIICMRFIELWVNIHHDDDAGDQDINLELCNIMDQARKLGPEPVIVAEAFKDHLAFLLNKQFHCGH